MYRAKLITIISTFLLVLPLIAQETSREYEGRLKLRFGLGAFAGYEGFGGSGRIWIRDALGFTLMINSDWQRDVEGGDLYLNFKLPLKTMVRPYLFAGGGIQMVNLTESSPAKYNEPLWNGSGGAAVEMYLGKSRRHGVAVEVGYRYGELDYKGVGHTDLGDEKLEIPNYTESVSGVVARALYHFYFIPRKMNN